MDSFSIRADVVDVVNHKLEASGDISTNRFKPIRFINNNSVDIASLPEKYGKLETLDYNGKIEVQIFNNSWFSKDYDKKVIAWRPINKNK